MANSLMGMVGKSPAASAESSTAGAGQMPNMQMIRQAAQSAKRMMGMLSAVKDPQKALMMAAGQNPQLNAVMQMVGNRNPKDVFAEQCKAYGLNPEETMKQIQEMMG